MSSQSFSVDNLSTIDPKAEIRPTKNVAPDSDRETAKTLLMRGALKTSNLNNTLVLNNGLNPEALISNDSLVSIIQETETERWTLTYWDEEAEVDHQDTCDFKIEALRLIEKRLQKKPALSRVFLPALLKICEQESDFDLVTAVIQTLAFCPQRKAKKMLESFAEDAAYEAYAVSALLSREKALGPGK